MTEKAGKMGSVVTGACMMLVCPALFAAMPPDSHPKDFAANAANHVVTITRTAASEIEKKMIAAAESAPPVIPAPEPGKASTTQATTSTWWCAVNNNIRVPYAINSAALAYYEELVKSYQKKTWKTYIEPRSSLTYEASVKHHDAFSVNGRAYKDVYVVLMKLAFNAHFTENGTLAVHFTKERTVVLDAKGAVLAVEGDGDTEAPLLAI